MGKGWGMAPQKLMGWKIFGNMMIFGKMGKWALFSEKNTCCFSRVGVGVGGLGMAP